MRWRSSQGCLLQIVQGEIRRLLGRQAPLMVQSAYEREQAYRSTQRQGLSRLSQIAALVLIAAALAMAAAMGAMIWQRRPRLAGMKVDGFDQGELWRALLCESALLLGAGCSIGAVFGLYGQLLLSHALVSVTGFPVVFYDRYSDRNWDIRDRDCYSGGDRGIAWLPRDTGETRPSRLIDTRPARPRSRCRVQSKIRVVSPLGRQRRFWPRLTRELRWGLRAVCAGGGRLARTGRR